MRTVIISFYEAYPPVCGAAVVTYNLAKYFPGETFLIQVGQKTERIKLEDNLTLISMGMDLNTRLKKAISLFSNYKKIMGHVESINPQFIILEGASWALYYWLLFKRLKKSTCKARIIYHTHNIEYLLRRQNNSRFVAALTKWAEGKLVNESDFVTTVSDEDAAQMKALYGMSSIRLSNGVNISRFGSVSASMVRDVCRKYNLHRKTVLFMGLVTYPPNKEGIDFLVNDVFPSVVKKYPEAKLAVIGGDLGFKKDWLINPGMIPYRESPAFIKACDVCTAPIFSGSGTRLKILEYMAAGKPVIATTKGAEGIAVTEGKDILLADSAGDFAKKIIWLLENPDSASIMGLNGRSMVKSTYGWESVINAFIAHIQEYKAGERS